MTGGNIVGGLPALNGVAEWNELHLSRIRRTDDGSLSTTGHTVSRSMPQIRESLQNHDISRLLVLDDTSFSGTTNVLAEQMVRGALPEREITVTHGFMVANEGMLEPGVPGAMGRLGLVFAGHRMCTPRDDGWHVFDIVKQPDLKEHLQNVERALLDPECEKELFAGGVHRHELQAMQKQGKFMATNEIQGEWHSRNPQLLPRIIEVGHVRPIKEWSNKNEVFDTLLRMGELLKGES